MSWDPITRIIGNLGIYTKIDFDNQEVVECKSTSNMFRGYSVFMRGKDPLRCLLYYQSHLRDLWRQSHHLLRIRGEYGVWNKEFRRWPSGFSIWAKPLSTCSTIRFFRTTWFSVDFCEQMVKETNPGLLKKAEKTDAPHADIHGHRTIADIMRSFNPFTGAMYKEALVQSRITREMFCLMEGDTSILRRFTRAGTGTVVTPQLFSDYFSRLLKFIDFAKKLVPMNDDLFNILSLQAMPGYEQVGNRRILLGCVAPSRIRLWLITSMSI